MGLEIKSSAAPDIIETGRLSLRELMPEDAAFMLELLNEPAFVRFIGDRGVRNIEDAQGYIEKGPMASYARLRFGLWKVVRKDSREAIGICGLVKREVLPDVDIGYAFLERFWSQGYAFEAALAVRDYARQTLGIQRLLGVTDQDNLTSIHVLEKLGLRYERLIRLAKNGPELKLFAIEMA